MNNFGCVPEEWFNGVKSIGNKSIEKFDPRCQESIRTINSIDNIATKWSCSGHCPDELEIYRITQAHLVLIVKNNPGVLVERFEKWVDQMDEKTWTLVRPKLTMIKLLFKESCIVTGKQIGRAHV